MLESFLFHNRRKIRELGSMNKLKLLYHNKLKQLDPCGLFCVLLAYLLLFYAYFVVIFILIVPLMNDTYWGILNGILFSFFALVCVISHLKASLSNPGYVSLAKVNLDFSDLHSADAEKELLKEGLTVCAKCEIYRPVDAHHCKICKRCIRRRHHHCQW